MNNSRITAIVSDIHFDLHDPIAWKAFRRWHTYTKPYHTVIMGDFVDLGMLSVYKQGPKDPVYAIPQIKMFVKEANILKKEATKVSVLSGNHDERWEKMILGHLGASIKDAKGLSLQEQCFAQGLNTDINFFTETNEFRGIKVGDFILRHGHNQSGRFGGGKHLSINRLSHTMGESEVIGHHHRIQMACQTHGGRTAIAVANGHLTRAHEYSKDSNWQLGFTVLEQYGPNFKHTTPHPIIIQNGGFAYGGKIYSGKS
jgi:predicted phosphodiesterase